MRQINEDTGTTRPIQRKVVTTPSNNNQQIISEIDTLASFGYAFEFFNYINFSNKTQFFKFLKHSI